jgi:acetyltransferase-like isoleucine patch superfamily enzyme
MNIINVLLEPIRWIWRGGRYVYGRAYLIYLGAGLGRRLIIDIAAGSKVFLGAGVFFSDGCIVSVRREMSAAGAFVESSLTVGERTFFNEYCNIRCGGGDISIGRECLFGEFVSLIGSTHNFGRGVSVISSGIDMARRNIVIGDNVWVGAGVTILPGVTVGSGVVIGANSVVVRDVPDDVVVAGSPARVIRYLS